MKEGKHIITGREVATEVFTSGWCNLNCEYCYIPKTDVMKDIHKEILSTFHTDYWINNLKTLYGDRLEVISLWGTEPLLTINSYRKVIEKAQEVFPKFNKISFSTNMIFVNSLIKFLETTKFVKPIDFEVQFSIDGPEYITDKNRNKGTTETILKNIEVFGEWYSKKGKNIKNLNLYTTLKQTLTSENLKYIMENDLVEDTAVFMLNLSKRIAYENMIPHRHSHTLTVAVPSKYTKEDGILFYEYKKELKEIEKKYNTHFDTYYYRLKRLINYIREYTEKPEMFTCSGGDSQWGIGYKNDLHICHRTLFLNDDRYIKEIEKLPPEKNHDIENQERGTVDLIKDRYVADIYNDYEFKRFRYILGNYHYFWKLRVYGNMPLIYEHAYSGLIDKVFLDEEIALIFSLFLNTALGCHMENLLHSGSLYLTQSSLIKMFGNGFFQEILKEVLNEHV